MSLEIITPPAVEPVSTAELKARLRIDHAHEDDLLSALISAARARVEMLTGCAFITQQLREFRDGWAPGDGWDAGAAVLQLARGPVSVLRAVKTIDEDGAEMSLDLSKIVVDTSAAPGRIGLMQGQCWPAPERPLAGISIEYDAGYGAAASDAPAPLREAVSLLAVQAYETRAPSADEDITQLPARVAALLSPFQRVRV